MWRVGLVFLLIGGLLGGSTGGVIGAPGGQEGYVLGPGDSLDVAVFGQPDLSRTVTIKPDGTISLPLIQDVRAAGMTTGQLETDLVKLYAKYLKAPSVTVTVREFHTERIYVLGQVNKPGEYQLRPGSGTGVLELLAAAGGPTRFADLAKAVVIRGKTQTTQLNLLEAIKTSKDPAVNLQSGDVVYIPQMDPRMIVLGQVNHPGAYDLMEGQHVIDLIGQAGGPTAQAALTHAYILRGQEQIPVDLQKAQAGDSAANVPLRPGDTLVVPESRAHITVLGAVNKPGSYGFTPGLKLIDAIALAGGQADRANLTQVGVARLEGGKTRIVKANVAKALNGQDMSQDIPLQDGDVVYVQKRGGLSIDQLLELGGLIFLH